jgi:hypothetical protein
MSNVICIAGESGSGKTTSCRNLDPATTYYIDCDKKGLSWKGWKDQYNPQKQNYLRTDFQSIVLKALRWINGQALDQSGNLIKDEKGTGLKYKAVVIDTLNGIMVSDEMRRTKEKGYDKWMDLASSIYDIIDYALTMRDNVTVIFVAHTQTERDDNGYSFTRIKTSGKKLDKITLESKFSTVLLARCIDGRFVFETKANNSTAKSPMGLIEAAEVDNDIVPIIKALDEF